MPTFVDKTPRDRRIGGKVTVPFIVRLFVGLFRIVRGKKILEVNRAYIS